MQTKAISTEESTCGREASIFNNGHQDLIAIAINIYSSVEETRLPKLHIRSGQVMKYQSFEETKKTHQGLIAW